jgi:RHS repeat-associated protein
MPTIPQNTKPLKSQNKAVYLGAAFGTEMSTRSFTSNSYRYGFNGMEKDDEVKGSGNSYSTFYRQLDTRLGRWFTLDPKGVAFETHYSAMSNSPIWFCDPLGDKIIIRHKEVKRDKEGKIKTNRKGEIKYKSVRTEYVPSMKPTADMDDYGKKVIESLNHLIDIGAGEHIKEIANDPKNDVTVLKQGLGKGPHFNGKESKKIYFNPMSGMLILDDNRKPTGQVVTPAELLGHEFKHAHSFIYTYDDWKKRRSNEYKKKHVSHKWANEEEEYTIKNYDNIYWKYPRQNHYGAEEIFLSPTDHSKTLTNLINAILIIR